MTDKEKREVYTMDRYEYPASDPDMQTNGRMFVSPQYGSVTMTAPHRMVLGKEVPSAKEGDKPGAKLFMLYMPWGIDTVYGAQSGDDLYAFKDFSRSFHTERFVVTKVDNGDGTFRLPATYDEIQEDKEATAELLELIERDHKGAMEYAKRQSVAFTQVKKAPKVIEKGFVSNLNQTKLDGETVAGFRFNFNLLICRDIALMKGKKKFNIGAQLGRVGKGEKMSEQTKHDAVDRITPFWKEHMYKKPMFVEIPLMEKSITVGAKETNSSCKCLSLRFYTAPAKPQDAESKYEIQSNGFIEVTEEVNICELPEQPAPPKVDASQFEDKDAEDELAAAASTTAKADSASTSTSKSKATTIKVGPPTVASTKRGRGASDDEDEDSEAKPKDVKEAAAAAAAASESSDSDESDDAKPQVKPSAKKARKGSSAPGFKVPGSSA